MRIKVFEGWSFTAYGTRHQSSWGGCRPYHGWFGISADYTVKVPSSCKR